MARSKECDALTDKMLKDAVRQKQDALSKKTLTIDVDRANEIIAKEKAIGRINVAVIEYGPRVSLCRLKTANNITGYCCRYNSNGFLTTPYFNINSAIKDYYELNGNLE